MSMADRKTIAIVVALLAAAGLSVVSSIHAADAGPRPNIIVIYTDDQGFGDASCLNPNAKFQTPNLDRLAAEGIAFTNAHCSDTVYTSPHYPVCPLPEFHGKGTCGGYGEFVIEPENSRRQRSEGCNC